MPLPVIPAWPLGRLQFAEDHPYYPRYHNQPCLMVNGKNLGTFGDSAPQLPVGTTYTVVTSSSQLFQALSICLHPSLSNPELQVLVQSMKLA